MATNTKRPTFQDALDEIRHRYDALRQQAIHYAQQDDTEQSDRCEIAADALFKAWIELTGRI